MERVSRIDMLRDMLTKEADDVFLNYALALELMTDLKTIREAEALFLKVLQLDENYLAAYYQLGKLFESELKNEEALGYYKSGLEKARIQKNNKAINEFGEAVFMLED